MFPSDANLLAPAALDELPHEVDGVGYGETVIPIDVDFVITC